MPDMLKQAVMRVRVAARDLTPAQKNDVTAIENKLKLAKKAISEAESALSKWKQSERYSPQKDNVVQEGKNLKGLGMAIANLAGSL